jgi:MinD-like ATPase involved in chromosome partitioning or flagellar assembly
LTRAVGKFLQVETKFVGWIPSDEQVRQCIMDRRPLALAFPSSSAARAILETSRSLVDNARRNRVKGGMQFFFRQLLELSYGEEAAR